MHSPEQVLVGVGFFFERGSVNQIMVALVMSFGFLAAHMHFWPYKIGFDNQFRAATEFHVFLVVAVGLAFKTDLDSPFAAARVNTASATPTAELDYMNDFEGRKTVYDWLLVGTFFVLVAAALVITIVLKVALVARLLKTDAPNSLQKEGSLQESQMRNAYKRFRYGLATGSDQKDLDSYLDQLDCDDHERAGKVLWREKQVAAHLSADEMAATLTELTERLPKSETLGFHFTDMDSCRLILNSQGIRASNIGQLGGGVSICLASLVELGWGKSGGTNNEFCKSVGEQLWGSKWHEVMPPGEAPENAHADWGKFHNKLECVLAVRIPSQENQDLSRIVPGRADVYIVPKRQCVSKSGDEDNGYYSNQHIEACFVLKEPDVGSNTLDEHDSIRKTRVHIKSDRDICGGMVNVRLKTVGELERILDNLEDNPAAPWCPAVTSCTAIVSKPPDRSTSILRTHTRIQQESASKQMWPENISRFSPLEMTAVLKQIDQAMLQTYKMVFYYTTEANATKMCKDGKGIIATSQPGGTLGVTVTTRSPVALGWEKNAAGNFHDVAGSSLWGPRWRATRADHLQAVLILGVPTKMVPTASYSFTIPQSLLVEAADNAYYANGHIHKLYLLAPADATKPSVSDTRGLHALFEKVDTDGGATLNKEEAVEYLRSKDITLDDSSMNVLWTSADRNGDGTLDLAEFSAFVESVERVQTSSRDQTLAAAPTVRPQRAPRGQQATFEPEPRSLASVKRQPPSLNAVALMVRTTTPPRQRGRTLRPLDSLVTGDAAISAGGAAQRRTPVAARGARGAGGGTRAGTSDWGRQWSEQHKRPYWVNAETNESSWEDPATAALTVRATTPPRQQSRTAPPLDSLDAGVGARRTPVAGGATSRTPAAAAAARSRGGGMGARACDWDKQWSEQHQRSYWVNAETGQSSWENPAAATSIEGLFDEINGGLPTDLQFSGLKRWWLRRGGTPERLVNGVNRAEFSEAILAAAQEDWQTQEDPGTGRSYHINTLTGVTSWDVIGLDYIPTFLTLSGINAPTRYL